MDFSCVFLSVILLVLSTYIQDRADAAEALRWTTLQGKSMSLTPQYSRYLGLPLTVDENDLIKNEFKKLSANEEFPLVSIYCVPDDPRICPLYDHQGRLCGMRVGFPIADIDKKAPGKMPYDYSKIAIFKKGSAYNMDIYYTDILFISPDSLKKGGPANRDEPVGNGLYVKLDGKSWTSVPREESGMVKTAFVKQSCSPGMGQYYFYKLDKNTPCTDVIPFFALYQDGQLIGCGLVPFGSFTSGRRVWFENIQEQNIPEMLSNYGTCVTEYVRNYGAIGLHMFFHVEVKQVSR